MVVCSSERILSWRSLYLLRCSAVLHALRTWRRIWCSPQRGHRGVDFFFHRHKFELCGRVSWEAFNANLKGSGGRDTRASAHALAEVGVAVRFNSPCRGKLRRWSRRVVTSSSLHFLLTAALNVFLLQDGSSIIVSLTITAGLNFFLWVVISSFKLSSAILLTVGSDDVSS